MKLDPPKRRLTQRHTSGGLNFQKPAAVKTPTLSLCSPLERKSEVKETTRSDCVSYAESIGRWGLWRRNLRMNAALLFVRQ